MDGKVQISPSWLLCLLPSETAVFPLGLHCSCPQGWGWVTDKAWRWVGVLLDGSHNGEVALPKGWSPGEFILWVIAGRSQAQSQPQTRTKIRNEAGSGAVDLLHFLFKKEDWKGWERLEGQG